MEKEVVVIGAGLSGLTCATLLAKKGLKVKVIETQFKPGGSCGIFKRNDVIFEQGAAMLYGFGEKGFNPHRFVFNSLEESIDMIKHDDLYAINYGEHRIVFYEDINKFINQLIDIFPNEKKGFTKFYSDMENLYLNVIAEHPTYISPDIVKKEDGLKQLLRHPLSYMKFLGYLNCSAESVLKKYFKDKEVFKFFDKLTSTYCYTKVSETPAVLSAVMFIDNHYGGSYYPAGSTMNLVGKLEKVIEENNGEMIYNTQVEKILVEDNKSIGVKVNDGSIISAEFIVYSGTIWNLYKKLINEYISDDAKSYVESIIPTYPSVVLYSLVKAEVIPYGTLPIEMLVSNKDDIDENELTAYILSIDDKTLCPSNYHTVITIGPSFKEWPRGYEEYSNSEEYKRNKEKEISRILDVLELRFPGFKDNLVYRELATPSTLERYVMKEKGAVAGPKQCLGQHMLKRLHVSSDIEKLYYCGESTIMGTGTPAVTVSGISAANAILRELEIKEYVYEGPCNIKYINIVKKPFKKSNIIIGNSKVERELYNLSSLCQFCEKPNCEKVCKKNIPIRDINRRLAVGNYFGAKKLLLKQRELCNDCTDKKCEAYCIRSTFNNSVSINKILYLLDELQI